METGVPLISPHSALQDRLLDSARETLLAVGAAGASARIIASSAGSAASAINYHFGGLEQLFAAVFERELQSAAAWAEALRAEVRDVPSGAPGAVAVLLHAIRSWTADRGRALLYAEARARTLSERALGTRFSQLFRSLFEELARTLALDQDAAPLMHTLFESQALFHLSRWRPALEDAALAELVERFVALWLAPEGHGPRPCPALDRAAELVAVGPDEWPPGALRLAEAAVAVVGRLGLEGLTHRAVAAEVGATAGAVAHYFRTSEDLVAGALRGQVELLMRSAEPGAAPISLAAFAKGYVARAAEGLPPAPVTGRQDLFLASLRREALATTGATIRYVHGSTTIRILNSSVGDRVDGAALATIVSLLFGGVWRAAAGAEDPGAERLRIAALAVTPLYD